MAILRNIQVAKRYNINPTTVTNWIEQAKTGKIKLELTKINNRYYIIDSLSNDNELTKLKEIGLKYRSKTNKVKIKPNNDIYKVFNEDHLIDLIVSITGQGYIPMKYIYLGAGAEFYNKTYIQSYNLGKGWPTTELDLVQSSLRYLLDKFDHEDKINLIDIGAGNSIPAKNILNELKHCGLLNNYILVDISKDIFKIAHSNVKNWFGGKVNVIEKEADFEDHSIRNIIFKESIDPKTKNVLLYLGSTLSNHFNRRVTLAHLAKSLGPEDYLWIGTALDTNTGTDKTHPRSGDDYDNLFEWIYKMLNLEDHIHVSDYEFNPITRTKKRYFTLKYDVELEFEIEGKSFIVSLEKDKKVDFFISYRYDLQEITKDFLDLGLTIDQYCCYKDNSYGLFLLRPMNK